MLAIYVHTLSHSGLRYSYAIAKNYKKLETRTRNVFKSFFINSKKQRIAIIETCKWKCPQVIGYCDIEPAFKCSKDEFKSFEMVNKHMVYCGSKFDCRSDFKWCYPVSNGELINPVPLSNFKVIHHGRSYCEIF